MSTDREILIDAICAAHGYTRAEAEEAERYVANLKSARHFIDIGTARLNCPACGDDGLNPACENFKALVALGHPRADEWMGIAWDRTAAESPWRQRGAPAARRTGVVVSPETGVLWQAVAPEAEATGARILAGLGRGVGRASSLVEETANTFARVLNRMTDEAVMRLGGPDGLQLAQFNTRREIRRDGVPLWFAVYEMGPDAIRITEEGFTEYAPRPLFELTRERRARAAARAITPAI